MVGGLIHTCTIQRQYARQRLTFTAGAGTPVIGQTVTGADSGEEGVIIRIGMGEEGVDDYIIIEAENAVFTIGEVIGTPTWSGILSTQIDSKNASGELEQYWINDQTGVRCRFYVKSSGFGQTRHDAGDLVTATIACILPPTVTIESSKYRIVSATSGYSGVYTIVNLYPRSSGGGLHHYEVGLSEGL